MRNRKVRLLSLLLATVMMLGLLAGCSSDGGSGSGSGGGSNGGGGGGRTDLTTDDTITITDSGTPTAQIGDGDVPLSPGDVIDQIVDTIVPLAVLPKTGDGSISYAALLAILLVSGGLAGGMYWKRKKTENTAE